MTHPVEMLRHTQNVCEWIAKNIHCTRFIPGCNNVGRGLWHVSGRLQTCGWEMWKCTKIKWNLVLEVERRETSCLFQLEHLIKKQMDPYGRGFFSVHEHMRHCSISRPWSCPNRSAMCREPNETRSSALDAEAASTLFPASPSHAAVWLMVDFLPRSKRAESNELKLELSADCKKTYSVRVNTCVESSYLADFWSTYLKSAQRSRAYLLLQHFACFYSFSF